MNDAQEFAQFMLTGFQAGHTISTALKTRNPGVNPYFRLACAEVHQTRPTGLDPALFTRATRFVEKTMLENKYRFTAEHVLRVRNLAVQIMPDGVDSKKIELACLLHDAGKHFGENHAEKGADMARQWLEEQGLASDDIPTWIREHASTPTTLPSQVLYDADKLDKIGISGACILLAKAYLKGLNIQQLVELYRKDSDVPRFFGKHKIGPDVFHTDAAKKLAPRRAKVTDTFFKELDV